MRKYLIAIALLLASAFPVSVGAQARIYLGVEAEDSFGNYGLGPTAALEVPLGKHFEWDTSGTYEPLASHIKLGNGYNYNISASGIGWLTDSWGLYGGLNDSAYRAGSVHKNQPHVFGGAVYRGIVGGVPARLFFGYTQEIRNGIVNGTESNDLHAFNVDYQVNFKHVRFDFNNYVGWVSDQGNPVCDGTFGPVTCPRQKTLSGGTSFGVTYKF